MAGRIPTDDRERIVAWLNFQQAHRVIESMLELRLHDEVGLSWAEYEVLFRLRVAGEHPLQMREIADQLIASPSGITRIADRLDRDGLITRETPPDNRRIVRLRLTERGEEMLERADRAFFGALAVSFSDHLSEIDMMTFRRLLRQLLEGNEAWGAQRCDPQQVS